MKNPLRAMVVVIGLGLTLCTPVAEAGYQGKGVALMHDDIVGTLTGDYTRIDEMLDAQAGVFVFNLPWAEAAPTRPTDPLNWDSVTYRQTFRVQALDKVSKYLQGKALLTVVVYKTPGWARCPLDVGDGDYPPQNASDFGDFIGAMSERYDGNKTGKGWVRDWVVYNEVNANVWWKNTACNPGLDQVQYYGASLAAAYSAVRNSESSLLPMRVLAGGFSSFVAKDVWGNSDPSIGVTFSQWQSAGANSWISPLDFVDKMAQYDLPFDGIALHPYPPTLWNDPLLPGPSGSVTIGTLQPLLDKLAFYWGPASSQPNEMKRHVALTEYAQQSYRPEYQDGAYKPSHDPNSYFGGATSEDNLNTYMLAAYGPGGSLKAYVDYLIWLQWDDKDGYTAGIKRNANGTTQMKTANGGCALFNNWRNIGMGVTSCLVWH